MACPARFERATLALEAVKMSINNNLDNSISLTRSGVQYAPRTLVLGGIAWISVGIRRRLDGQMSNLTGKPTKLKPPMVGFNACMNTQNIFLSDETLNGIIT